MSTPTVTPHHPSAVPPRMSWPSVVAWHLLPGLALTCVAVGAGELLDASGLPRIWALLGGVIVVQVPLLLALRAWLLIRRPRSTGTTRLQGRSRRFAIFAATLVAALLLPGLASWSEAFIRMHLFSWLPEWWSAGPASLVGLDSTESVITLTLWILGPVLLGPIAEELYFRGALLPRVPAGPWRAAAASAGLFAIYHLWQPYAVLTVFLFALPIAVARARFGAGMVTCAVIHGLVNLGMLGAFLTGAAAR